MVPSPAPFLAISLLLSGQIPRGEGPKKDRFGSPTAATQRPTPQPDEDHIAVGTGQTGMWTVLTLDINEALARAAGQLTRGFTDEECRVYRIDPCPTIDQVRVAALRGDG